MWDNGPEGVLFNDLECKMKRFWFNNNVLSMSSSNLETLERGDKEKFYGVIGAIATTSYNVIDPLKLEFDTL